MNHIPGILRFSLHKHTYGKLHWLGTVTTIINNKKVKKKNVTIYPGKRFCDCSVTHSSNLGICFFLWVRNFPFFHIQAALYGFLLTYELLTALLLYHGPSLNKRKVFWTHCELISKADNQMTTKVANGWVAHSGQIYLHAGVVYAPGKMEGETALSLYLEQYAIWNLWAFFLEFFHLLISSQ